MISLVIHMRLATARAADEDYKNIQLMAEYDDAAWLDDLSGHLKMELTEWCGSPQKYWL